MVFWVWKKEDNPFRLKDRIAALLQNLIGTTSQIH
jgi:hypothetical protein